MTEVRLEDLKKRIHGRLEFIFRENYRPDEINKITESVLSVCQQYLVNKAAANPLSDSDARPRNNDCQWSEQDIILITYGDSIQKADQKPLRTLAQFSQQWLLDCVSTLHILPFFPFSSDDGFSVVDYRMVNPNLGDWKDIEVLHQSFDLMMDLVINHCSRESLWFSDYIANQAPYNRYFIEADPNQDLSQVTRPRNTPLLTPVHTHRGVRHLWATFSEDQIDLNFANADVLIEFITIYLFYISQGARFIRLDAVAFLWKKLGTRCLHLPETHEVVKLLRDLLDYLAPEVVLITETNVPVAENLSYFGAGDEAHMVYQFGLPPLVLHALNRGNSNYLSDWASTIPELPHGCTYLNFTASHDGIGVRPIEGILPKSEVQSLIDTMHEFGGFLSMKANPDGSESPYEINITLFDACMGTRRGIDHLQVARFICSQAVMLSMRGIPALYIHSLMASPNDLGHVEQTGRTRSINRRIWDYQEITDRLAKPQTAQYQVYQELSSLLTIRRRQAAFHPDAKQQIIKINSDLFIVKRQANHSADTPQSMMTSTKTAQVIYAIHNMSDRSLTLPLSSLGFLPPHQYDLISRCQLTDVLSLAPYQCVWLTDEKETNDSLVA